MFHILMISVLIMSLVMIVRLRSIQKHDGILFKFCDVRRKTMRILRVENFQLSKDDYFSSRRLLDAVSLAIHDYDTLKTSVLNLEGSFDRFTELQRASTELMETVSDLEKKKDSSSSDILALYREFLLAMFSGHLAYTPFLRSKIILVFIVAILRLFVRLSGKYLYSVESRADRMLESISWLKKSVMSSVCA